jgi:hypothetical protein
MAESYQSRTPAERAVMLTATIREMLPTVVWRSKDLLAQLAVRAQVEAAAEAIVLQNSSSLNLGANVNTNAATPSASRTRHGSSITGNNSATAAAIVAATAAAAAAVTGGSSSGHARHDSNGRSSLKSADAPFEIPGKCNYLHFSCYSHCRLCIVYCDAAIVVVSLQHYICQPLCTDSVYLCL